MYVIISYVAVLALLGTATLKKPYGLFTNVKKLKKQEALKRAQEEEKEKQAPVNNIIRDTIYIYTGNINDLKEVKKATIGSLEIDDKK